MTILNLGTLEGPILLFGGPYSNLQATWAMRNVAEERGIPPQNIICNGDVVAYCGNPEETVECVRDWDIHTVMGNCEESVGEMQDDCGCGFEADTVCSLLSVEWYRFVSGAVSAGSRQWMRQLPKNIRFNSAGIQFTVIHGGVQNMSEFVFASSDPRQKHRDAASINTDCVIGGHCGIPFGQRIDDQYWINTGVIGMPANDGCQNGWYVMLEPQHDKETPTIHASWHRLKFDNATAAAAMNEAGLGSAYQDALLSGLWPSMDILPRAERLLQGQQLSPPVLAFSAAAKPDPIISTSQADPTQDAVAVTAR